MGSVATKPSDDDSDGTDAADDGSADGSTSSAGKLTAGSGSGPGSGGRAIDPGATGVAEGNTVVDFGGKDGAANGADSVAASDGGADGGKFDPDDSSTWSEAEMLQRRTHALDMDPDEYFKLIGKGESIFKRVHLRYQKIHGRWVRRAPAIPLPAP
jgi:hypothetical protein